MTLPSHNPAAADKSRDTATELAAGARGVTDLAVAYWRSCVLFAANKLDLFSTIAAGALTAADVSLLCGALGSEHLGFDLTDDGQVSGADVSYFVRSLVGTEFGDANLDGQVTASGDGSILLSNLASAGPHDWGTGDFDCSGTVTASGDGGVLLQNLSADAVAVPEPTGWLWSLGCGASLLASKVGRRRTALSRVRGDR